MVTVMKYENVPVRHEDIHDPVEAVPLAAYVFRNGMMMVFDSNGEQVPEYQGRADEMLGKLKVDFPNCPIEEREWRRP